MRQRLSIILILICISVAGMYALAHAQNPPPIRAECFLNDANTEYRCYNSLTGELLFPPVQKNAPLFEGIKNMNSLDFFSQKEYVEYDPVARRITIRSQRDQNIQSRYQPKWTPLSKTETGMLQDMLGGDADIKILKVDGADMPGGRILNIKYCEMRAGIRRACRSVMIMPDQDMAEELGNIKKDSRQYYNLLEQPAFVSMNKRSGFSPRQLRAPAARALDQATIHDPLVKHYFFSGDQIKLPDVYAAYAKTYNFNKNGTAFLISRQGDVITNHHVFYSSQNINSNILNDGFIVVDGKRISMKGARLIYDGDEDKTLNEKRGIDMVILRIPALAGNDYIRLAPRLPQKGDQVFLLGHPADLNLEKVCSVGTISNLHLENCSIHSDNEARRGNSGGPLVNKKGELVGVNYMLGQSSFTNTISSIDGNTIREVMERYAIPVK